MPIAVKCQTTDTKRQKKKQQFEPSSAHESHHGVERAETLYIK